MFKGPTSDAAKALWKKTEAMPNGMMSMAWANEAVTSVDGFAIEKVSGAD